MTMANTGTSTKTVGLTSTTTPTTTTTAAAATTTTSTPTTMSRPPPSHGNTTILIRGQLHGVHQDAANAVVSLILVIMVGFVVFMTIFFWKKYKHITLSLPTYQYSRLSQTEGEADLTEIVDQLGLSIGISSSDDELEPATLSVSSSQYPGPRTGKMADKVAGQNCVSNGLISNGLGANGRRLTEDSDEELLQ